MTAHRTLLSGSRFLLALSCFSVSVCFAQFTASIQGIVQDPTGAVIPKASITLLNFATNVVGSTTTDNNGNYHFESLAPGNYRVTAEAAGFAKATVNLTLETDQNLNVPISVTVAAQSQAVNVTSEAPLLNTAETRNEMTLETQTLSEVPLAGRNLISLATFAPGAVGLGTSGNGSPGSGVDNYSTETQVDLSANGQGSVANMFIVDGLDITSAIRPGVLNLTPNPDSVAEASIQVNTFTVEYGRASSIQMAMTTKSGTDAFHGNASDYFTDQHLFAGTEFIHNYSPFHSNNMSASLGGPIVPHHQFFFFGSVEPLWSSTASGSVTTFEDPAFTQWAETNFPNTFGTKLLTSYKPSNATTTGVSQTAANLFPGTCGTAATSFLPCNLAVTDTGVFNATNFRNGLQWNVRIDKYFQNDRIYGNFYRTTLNYGGPVVRPAFAETNVTFERALQVNETHTFSPSTLNEAAFGMSRVEGITPQTGLFSVPLVNVTGLGQGFGDGFAAGDFIQHNYHWRDILTHIHGAHSLKFGYEGWTGDDVEDFQGPHAQPTFQYNNLLDLVEDHPYNETGVAYDPVTGKPVLWDWNAASRTHGLFAEDVWKVKPNLTLTLGVRWDDFGNPYSRSPLTVFGNFYYGAGLTLDEQIANGYVRQTQRVFNHAQTGFQPRVGVAWSPDKAGNWVVRGGFGIYNNWVTPANAQEEFRGNPPGPIYPTFYSNKPGTPAPLLTLGTNNTTPPFGFTYPVISGYTIDSHGGIVGLSPSIGAIDPNLTEPIVYVYSGSVERKLGSALLASGSYSGSQGRSMLAGGGQEFSVSYGQDINAFAGDLIQNNQLSPTRLNPSFGEIFDTSNNRVSSYNALVASLQGRFGRAFFNTSYTRSSSMDDTQVYPSEVNPHVYFGPSIWDAPNRFSLVWNYTLPGLNQGHGFMGRVTGGWSISGTSLLQSGYPFTVSTNAPFIPLTNASGKFIGYAPGSGDYNADGDNYDFPDVSGYTENMSRQGFLNGVFSPTQFTTPAFGTEGNEKSNLFRNPRFAETDAALLKDTNITERVKLQLRFEFFNIFNHPNLEGVDANLPDATFGRSTAQYLPRWIQFGANLKF